MTGIQSQMKRVELLICRERHVRMAERKHSHLQNDCDDAYFNFVEQIHITFSAPHENYSTSKRMEIKSILILCEQTGSFSVSRSQHNERNALCEKQEAERREEHTARHSSFHSILLHFCQRYYVMAA